MGERERDVRSVRFAELLEGSADPKGHTLKIAGPSPKS